MIQPFHLLFLSLLGATVAAASPAADLASAQALFEAGKYPEAQQQLERMAASDPANADVHYYLGRIALEHEDPETAIHEMERAVALTRFDQLGVDDASHAFYLGKELAKANGLPV